MTNYEHLKMCEEEQELCNDAISRQSVLDLLFNSYIKTELTSIGNASKEYAELCVDELNELPSVNPQEKTGQWIIYDVHGHKACKCSECDKDVGYPCNYKYCPYCGAMIVESKELNK